ncbi:hypothetical protein PENTCL1PPCAC_30269, partial [Pristionchus entomophagus]
SALGHLTPCPTVTRNAISSRAPPRPLPHPALGRSHVQQADDRQPCVESEELHGRPVLLPLPRTQPRQVRD